MSILKTAKLKCHFGELNLMPKICDPPNFEGGQCPVRYTIACRVRQFENGSLINTANFFHSNSNIYFGAISSISPAVKAAGDSVNGFKVACRDSLGNPIIREIPSGFSTYTGLLVVVVDNISVQRTDGLVDDCGSPQGDNCRCSDDSCRVDCAGLPDGFCCIDHSLTDRLLDVLQV